MAISFKLSSLNLRFLIPFDFEENNTIEDFDKALVNSATTGGLDEINLFPTITDLSQNLVADEMSGVTTQESGAEDDSDQTEIAAKVFEQTSLKISKNKEEDITPIKTESNQVNHQPNEQIVNKESQNNFNETPANNDFDSMWEILSDSAIQFFKSVNESENSFRYKYTSHEMINDKLYLNKHLNEDPILFERNRDDQQLEELKKEDKLQNKEAEENKKT